MSRVCSLAIREGTGKKSCGGGVLGVQGRVSLPTQLPQSPGRASPRSLRRKGEGSLRLPNAYSPAHTKEKLTLDELSSAGSIKFRYWYATAAEAGRGSPGWPLLIPSPGTRAYYLTQAGSWLTSIIYLGFNGPRKDSALEFVRGLVVFFFVVHSYACSFWRPGLVRISARSLKNSPLQSVRRRTVLKLGSK